MFEDGAAEIVEEEQKPQQQQSLIDAEMEILSAASRLADSDNILQTTQAGSTSPRNKFCINKSHEDHISNLPDSITSHILSQLCIEEAVATSVLSRNWRYKWTSIYDITLSTSYSFWGPENDMDARFQSFRSFLNRILVLNEPWKMRSFDLSSYWNLSEDMQEWATAVLRRNVQNLKIWSPLTDCSASQQCFSGWTSLTELKLCLKCTVGVSASHCFSSLKSLCLRNGVQIKNEESQNTSRILLSFPVLEVLELKYCEWVNIDSVEIEAPRLIRFTSASFENQIQNFRLNAPEVTHACLDHQYSDNFALWACTILKGFQNLRCLILPGRSLKDFVKEPLFDFSTHDHLEELKIGYHIVDKSAVMEFLQAFPYLQTINMNMKVAAPHGAVQVVEPLPLCIRSHLKKFKYNRLDGEMNEFDLALVESILKNAKNLQEVIVSGYKEEYTAILLHRFSKLIPEGSSYALFTGEYDDCD